VNIWKPAFRDFGLNLICIDFAFLHLNEWLKKHDINRNKKNALFGTTIYRI